MPRPPSAPRPKRPAIRAHATSTAARWRSQVRERLGETARLRVRAGFPSELWSPTRARRYARDVSVALPSDPLLARLLQERARSYLDLGAGTGRYAIALARAGREVVAVEPSAGMCAELERGARGEASIRIVPADWPVAGVTGDVAFAAHVLFLVEDAERFVRAMTAAATRRCYLLLAALHSDAITDPLWRHFHGTPRRSSPTYLDAVALVREQGVRARVVLLPAPRPMRYRSLARAISTYREHLALPGDAATVRELRNVLRSWLVRLDGGFEPPAVPRPALIEWRP